MDWRLLCLMHPAATKTVYDRFIWGLFSSRQFKEKMGGGDGHLLYPFSTPRSPPYLPFHSFHRANVRVQHVWTVMEGQKIHTTDHRSLLLLFLFAVTRQTLQHIQMEQKGATIACMFIYPLILLAHNGAHRGDEELLLLLVAGTTSKRSPPNWRTDLPHPESILLSFQPHIICLFDLVTQ